MARGRKSSLVVLLTATKRSELAALQRRTTISAGLARRARMVLLRADGCSLVEVARRVEVAPRGGGVDVGTTGERITGWGELACVGRGTGDGDGGGRTEICRTPTVLLPRLSKTFSRSVYTPLRSWPRLSGLRLPRVESAVA